MYRATDRAGNVESINTQVISINSPNSVIVMPLVDSPSGEDVRVESGVDESKKNDDINERVLGEQVERRGNETYTKDDILQALSGNDINTLLDYLGKERNIEQEKSVAQKYNFDSRATNFVYYGTKSTDILGEGERAGVVYSFKEAFGRMPSSLEDWDDVIRISTYQFPIQRSLSAEQKAKDSGATDEKSIMMIAYGIRPEKRDLNFEINALKDFVVLFGRLPNNNMDWNILRSLIY